MAEINGRSLLTPRPTFAGRAAPVLVALLLPAAFVSTACAQNERVRAHPRPAMGDQDLAGLTPLHLHRLAGIVDMNRSGEPVWVAINPHDGFAPCRSDAFASADSAAVMEWASAVGHEYYEVYGPFQTRSGPDWETEVVRVEVTYRDIAADTMYRETVDIENVDALFLTPSATERFLLPYVVETYGIEIAGEWYESLLRRRRGIGGHWNSCPMRIGTSP